MGRAFYWLMLGVVSPPLLTAQGLERQIAAAPDGTVRLSFAARPGVCGDGLNSMQVHERTDEWEANCQAPLIHVALEVRGHRVAEIRTYVGGHWRNDPKSTDLGRVGSGEAAAYFIGLASQPREIEGDPVLAATLADSTILWPSLLRLARNSELPAERRRTAVFWLGQAAGAAAGEALGSVASDPREDREVRKQAVFALSQRPSSEGVPVLIRIAKANPDPELRKTALFWLGQSDDPRALDLFEEILR